VVLGAQAGVDSFQDPTRSRLYKVLHLTRTSATPLHYRKVAGKVRPSSGTLSENSAELTHLRL